MTQDANDILMGGGSAALKFDTIGVSHTSTVAAEPTSSQQTDFRTKAPETWPDGSPKMQVLVQLSTTLRDPAKPDDDGTRTLYIKGKELTNAIRNAVRASGASGIHTGGVLTITYVADGPAQAGLSAPKLYAAQYQPPAVSFAGVTASAAPAPAAPVQAYATQPAPAAVAQQALPGTLACPPGVDPGMWATLPPATQEALVAAHTAQQQRFPAEPPF
ncbi:hypothetical protein [Actinoplanes regularis]|uniref:Uncharacterized protein n=1 Tax=Actinoplanes regularis TaxID=52697 RepID=A0A238WRA7_9ACTN|nr:hypothetical protein [Actinoplanes regularis]GIE84591.1 hypothetical protein Are01nite_10710 [Actinoplanes regularis]SNR49007.1 hypothetical protein SAMN06264365_102822 [Actinoplanes regularis]